MSPRVLIGLGVVLLIAAWAGPLPRLVPESFAAHMALHMGVVGIAVPILAAGLAPLVADHPLFRSQLALPIAVSLFDLVIVWGWHTPALHHASRTSGWMLTYEQASFAIASLLVWVLALAAPAGRRESAALAGALTLFFTSMHMTLLGALIGLAPRPIYPGHAHHSPFGLSQMADQQVGGVIMLAIGGIIYLLGGLTLVARALRRPALS
ncbi:cytochrome c oxidase assembly protein [Devosia sediminis]|uniref:Cytochrome c oxidase assembly protein n=1 Tax=Devosia sediminis TaxID=2798801 RepID=A0A934IZE6_9HYPH|nr:cytochrome c oxidase assembly protein [Devosia sediminis]MBJ3785015.1 cytochrome c oxidase assembly protein [Devosia sediminis]